MEFTTVENYAASDVLPFLKKTDMYNGKSLNLGNMNGGFPVTIFGHKFYTAEAAYICASYGKNTQEAINVQREIEKCQNGMTAKRIFRHRKKISECAREDFDISEWRFQWMFYVVWCKTTQNDSFAKILSGLPQDKIIMENGNHGKTGGVWGCKNSELQRQWNEFNKAAEEKGEYATIKELKKIQDDYRCDTVRHFGTWTGQNVMGKILSCCRQAVMSNSVPDIDYQRLNAAEIYWFGEKIVF